MTELGRKLRRILELEQVWQDNIDIAQDYHEHLSAKYDAEEVHTEYQWKHLSDSFLEWSHLKKMRELYLADLDDGKLDEALDIANRALGEPEESQHAPHV